MRIYAATGRVHSRARVLHRIRTRIYRGTKEGEEREKRNRAVCSRWAGQNGRERTGQGRAWCGDAGQRRAPATGSKKERDKERATERVEAWLKARRVLAMADDFQLLLSPSREWKMENPGGGIYTPELNSFTLKVSREPPGLLSFHPRLPFSLSSFHPGRARYLPTRSYTGRGSTVKRLRETRSCRLSMEISWISRIKGLNAMGCDRFVERNGRTPLPFFPNLLRSPCYCSFVSIKLNFFLLNQFSTFFLHP